MKKFIIFVLWAVSATVSMAQVNPKSGIVITNTGDTLRGNIDLRTNEKLSKQCTFQANGESETKIYKPGDIEGFRFDEGGKFFVTRRLNVTGEPQLYFAEFMVQGKMNLYCITHNSEDHFFFEREDGEMAELTDRTLDYSSLNAFQAAKNEIREKQKEYGKVKFLLKDSQKAVNDMDEANISRKKLVNVVRDYHNDVCTDGSKCVVYEYDEKSDKSKVHFKAFVGFAHYSTDKMKYFGDTPAISFPNNAFEIGVGAEIDLERWMKDLSVEADIAFSPKTESKKVNNKSIIRSIEQTRLVLNLGFVKRFGKGKIQPLARAGMFGVAIIGGKELRYYPGYDSGFCSYELSFCMHTGVYLGAGAQMALGKHFVRLHGDVYKSLFISELLKLGVTAEFGF